MSFAALFAACDWLGLQVELVLICVNSRGLEFACLFPGWKIGRSSSLGNEFYPADSTDIVHGKFLRKKRASAMNDPFGDIAGDGSSFPLQSHLSTSLRNRINGWLPFVLSESGKERRSWMIVLLPAGGGGIGNPQLSSAAD
jgi:hypothetical protein